MLDDLSTGRLENIAGMLGAGGAELVCGSVTDLDLLERTCRGMRYVFHLAAVSRVPLSVAHPVTSNRVNVDGTLNVLLAARDNRVEKVVYASSSAVYGDNPGLPQHEDLLPRPVSPYAASKMVSEHYADVFRRIYGLPTVSLRFFNAYGTGQNPESPYSNVIPLFVRRLAQGLEPVIFDDGEQSRDFVYIRDLVRAALLVAEGSAEGALNIGSGQATTVNRLLELIGEIMGCAVKPRYEAARPGDPRHTLADVRRAREIGFKTEYDIARGLCEVVPHYAARDSSS